MKLTKSIIKKLLVGSFLFTGVMGTTAPLQGSARYPEYQEISVEQRTEELFKLVKLLHPDLSKIEKLIKAGVNINAQDKDGDTPLHWAVMKKNSEAVKLLLEQPGININAQDKDGDTPLHLAVKNKDSETVKPLLAHGASVKIPNKDSYTVLELAQLNAEKVPPEIQQLVKNHIVQCQTNVLFNLLKKELPSVDKVKKLINKGVNINVKDNAGNTLLHVAMLQGNPKIVKLLLKQPGIDVNAQNKNRNTPLHLAAKSNNEKIVELLLSKSGIDINAQNKNRSTPLHWAVKSNNEKIVELLLNKPGININAQNKNRNTPLHSAVKSNNEKIVELLLNKPGIDINVSNKHKSTPVCLAIKSNNEKIVTLLRKHSANVDVENCQGRTVSGLAKNIGAQEIPELIEERRAENQATEAEVITTSPKQGTDRLGDFLRRSVLKNAELKTKLPKQK
ncbi:MAG: ankyrin repeat domain-containing protein [Puniceicoccales bacterium]|jgi:cytohesin|nr:ankyrin repeat domain-containing protein [Puniceicoccales bacterium]